MRKAQEIADPNSCINKADDQELVFVLRGKDKAAPEAIRHWAQWRVATGQNKPDDPKIVEALKTADQMEEEQDKWK